MQSAQNLLKYIHSVLYLKSLFLCEIKNYDPLSIYTMRFNFSAIKYSG